MLHTVPDQGSVMNCVHELLKPVGLLLSGPEIPIRAEPTNRSVPIVTTYKHA